MATPKKKGKGRVKAKKKDPNHKTKNTYAVKPHRYNITYSTGAPAFYDSWSDMERECNGYFIYILGEWEEKVIVVTVKGKRVKKKQEVCVREPEPPTVTGLALYLGFASVQSLEDYAKRGPDFSAVIKRAKLRVQHRYEKNLHGEKPTGSIFALKNMGWKDNNFMGEDGAVAGILAWNYITPKQPKDDEQE